MPMAVETTEAPATHALDYLQLACARDHHREPANKARGFITTAAQKVERNQVAPAPSGKPHAVVFTERSPLFGPSDPRRVADIHSSRLRADRIFGFPRSLVQSECAFMSSLAVQMLLNNTIEIVPGILSGVMTGHLSDTMSSEYIAARSLSWIFMLLSGYTVNIAIGAAMDTLCAQAYGAGKLHEMGIFFQTGLLLFSVCLVPVTLSAVYCVELMVLLGQRRDIALLARNLVMFMLPSLPFGVVNALLGRILQGQNIITPMVYAGLVGNVVHTVVIYVLMFHTSVGYVASAIASSLLVVCYSITLVIYFFQSHLYEREWPGWRLHDALKILPEFIRLGVSGLGMSMFELWAFSAVALFAGWLPFPDEAISADSTYSSFRMLCFILYGTVAVSGSIRVGNALGANDPERAKLAAFLSVALSIVLALLSSFVMLLLRNIYPYAYTNNRDVVALTSRLMLVTCPFQVFAAVTAVGQGVMRGSGMQLVGARLNFVAFLALALPVGLTLAYQFRLGLAGLWLGLCVGFVCSGSYSIYWLATANWTEMAADAQKRTREPSERSPEGPPCLC